MWEKKIEYKNEICSNGRCSEKKEIYEICPNNRRKCAIRMKLEVLVSCMNKSEFSIIKDSNLNNVYTLIVNQCDKDKNIRLSEKHRVINTKTRGLSVSRNIALSNALGDICLICDDDECFIDDLEYKIVEAYKSLPDADIIIFNMINWGKKLGDSPRLLSKLELMRVSSVQITFKKNAVKGKISFDPLLGAGTINGSGEENKFLLDCYRQQLKIYYAPINIGSVAEVAGKSTWFFGYNKDYFYKRGSMTRYIYGFPFAVVYAVYFALSKKSIYGKDSSMIIALGYTLKGIFNNNIAKQNKLKDCTGR